MVNREEVDVVMIPRKEYVALIQEHAILKAVGNLVSNTSYVSRHDLLLILGAEDKAYEKEGEK